MDTFYRHNAGPQRGDPSKVCQSDPDRARLGLGPTPWSAIAGGPGRGVPRPEDAYPWLHPQGPWARPGGQAARAPSARPPSSKRQAARPRPGAPTPPMAAPKGPDGAYDPRRFQDAPVVERALGALTYAPLAAGRADPALTQSLADRLGWAPPVVRADPQGAWRTLQKRDARQALSGAPATAACLARPGNAVLARGGVDHVVSFERAFDRLRHGDVLGFQTNLLGAAADVAGAKLVAPAWNRVADRLGGPHLDLTRQSVSDRLFKAGETALHFGGGMVAGVVDDALGDELVGGLQAVEDVVRRQVVKRAVNGVRGAFGQEALAFDAKDDWLHGGLAQLHGALDDTGKTLDPWNDAASKAGRATGKMAAEITVAVVAPGAAPVVFGLAGAAAAAEKAHKAHLDGSDQGDLAILVGFGGNFVASLPAGAVGARAMKMLGGGRVLSFADDAYRMLGKGAQRVARAAGEIAENAAGGAAGQMADNASSLAAGTQTSLTAGLKGAALTDAIFGIGLKAGLGAPKYVSEVRAVVDAAARAHLEAKALTDLVMAVEKSPAFKAAPERFAQMLGEQARGVMVYLSVTVAGPVRRTGAPAPQAAAAPGGESAAHAETGPHAPDAPAAGRAPPHRDAAPAAHNPPDAASGADHADARPADAAHTDAPRAHGAHADAPRADAPRADAPPADAPPADAPHPDAPQADGSHADGPVAEPPRADTPPVAEASRAPDALSGEPPAPHADAPKAGSAHAAEGGDAHAPDADAPTEMKMSAADFALLAAHSPNQQTLIAHARLSEGGMNAATAAEIDGVLARASPEDAAALKQTLDAPGTAAEAAHQKAYDEAVRNGEAPASANRQAREAAEGAEAKTDGDGAGPASPQPIVRPPPKAPLSQGGHRVYEKVWNDLMAEGYSPDWSAHDAELVAKRLEEIAAEDGHPDAWAAYEHVDAETAAGAGDPGVNRRAMVGGTPSKSSPVGREVIAREIKDKKLSGPVPAKRADVKNVRARREDGTLEALDSTYHMAHRVAAVRHWNRAGKFMGKRHEMVRRFMNDPGNYDILPGAKNMSDGGRETERYHAPARSGKRKGDR